MSNRWVPIRRLAAEARESAAQVTPEQGVALVRAALGEREIVILSLRPDDPLLRGGRAVYDSDYVGYDYTLNAEQLAFALAHELGHAIVHGESCHCAEADITDEPVSGRLPFGAAAVDVYNPRQQRELEANVFAATFLLPSETLKDSFLAGATFLDFAEQFGVSSTMALAALADTLLHPFAPAAEESKALDALDDSQRMAAEASTGPTLVVAGPGTGKTRSLIGRAIYLLGTGIPARQVLAITYSNGAANELRERLANAVPEYAHEWCATTFHAFCLETLRRFHDLAGLPADFQIADGVDAAVLLERHLAALRLEHFQHLGNPTHYLGDLVRAIARAKDELADPEQYAGLAAAALAAATSDKLRLAAEHYAEVARVYTIYEQLLAVHGLVDFGGLIMRTVALLRENPDVLSQLRREYPVVLVDEYQDMNRASAQLLKLLAGDGRQLWVVGDLRQAIYRFRGASPANINDFTRDFPGGKIIGLGRNYRSDPSLVALLRAAGGSMASPSVTTSDWDAHQPGKPPPRVWVAEADDETSEAEGIAAEIRRRHAEGYSYKDQVVLVRAHYQAEPIVDALARGGIPVLHLGDLFAQQDVRDLLALIALVAEGDGGALVRVGDMEEYPIPRRERAQLVAYARQQREWFPAALRLAPEAGLSPGAIASVKRLHAAIEALGWQTNPWQFLTSYLFGQSDLVRRLLRERSAASAHRLLAIGQLLAVARAFTVRSYKEDSDLDSGLRPFLSFVRRLVASGESTVRMPPGGDDLDAVRVLTIHACKGLEFPVVYVTNLADERFPMKARMEVIPAPPGLIDGSGDGRLLEEERLFFVAISRAKHDLILSRAAQYGGRNGFSPSPLLALVEPYFVTTPPVLLSWRSAHRTGPSSQHAGDPILRGLEITELMLYLRCPRQYEYRYGLHLLERDDLLAYRRFQGCVNRVIAVLRKADAVHDEITVQTLLAEEWERNGPCGHPYEGLYRERAETLAANYLTKWKQSPPGPIWLDDVEIELGGATVRMRIDNSEMGAGGVIRLRQLRTGPERPEDQRDPRLSLLRKAAKKVLGPQAKIAIELEYLATGKFKQVPYSSTYDDPRIEKLEAAAAGIVAGHFPANPQYPRVCATCPYWMICPA